MSFKLNSNLQGVNEMLAKLTGIDRKMRKKVARKAVAQGSTVLLRAMKPDTPEATGLMKRSLGKKVVTIKRSGVVVAFVRPRPGQGAMALRNGHPVYSDPAKYGHLVELGTKPHGAHPGTKPRPFMRPALDASKSSIMASMENVVRNGLEDAAKG